MAKNFGEVLIIQPPLVQLNSPYPAGAYLSAFFRDLGLKTKWLDLSLELFLSIFSHEGLSTLFSLSKKTALLKAERAQRQKDEATAFNLRRYISQKDAWISWIDNIRSILSSASGGAEAVSGRELCHRFIFSPYAPRGFRMQRFIDSLDREITCDDARTLASFALEDLADYIAAAFDEHFSLIRYAESLAINESSFSSIEQSLDSPVLKTFYRPILERIQIKTKTLVCISSHFPGTLASSLFTGRFLKQKYKDEVFISLGGGFVNTELRNANDESLAKYIDALSFDRGYGSYFALLNCEPPLYKMRLFQHGKNGVQVIEPKDNAKAKAFEEEQTKRIFPDYSDINFSAYPRLSDDENAMHRLWSDGSWLKAYLAHGCYWHKCAFCDVTLDYVCAYRMTDTKALFRSLLHQAQKKGVRGVHFVDEACPPSALASFALENAKKDTPLSCWGNIRFEKTFTRDLADFLSFGGIIAVSGGIEIATGGGLDEIHKGTDLDSIVGACAAFKEAGILVHAYMIYGYWEETPQMLIDSLETLRQFFSAGLIDSAFYHKFVLTRHSRIFKEWKEGKYPSLKPIIPEDTLFFAQNGLHFEGEEKSAKYEEGLSAAIDSWMHSKNLEKDVRLFFPFKTPAPSVPRDYIKKAIARYEERENKARSAELTEKTQFYWLAGIPIATKRADGREKIIWQYMQEEESCVLPPKTSAKAVCELLYSLRPQSIDQNARKTALATLPHSLLKSLRGRGLCAL